VRVRVRLRVRMRVRVRVKEARWMAVRETADGRLTAAGVY
jgi:hypothetical protein